jgi:ribosomal protein S18 acetylase RimI-like enzyme
VNLRDEPLTGQTMGDVIAFFRRSNPFAQMTWGWDTGRLMDWRWGSNARRHSDPTEWFAAQCRIFRDADGDIAAVALAEEGHGDICIVTSDEAPSVIAAVLQRLPDTSLADGCERLEFESADDAEWLRTVFAAHAMTETPNTGHEWEYDLAVTRPVQLPDGFRIETLADDDPAELPEVARCIAASFDTDHDVTPTLASIEANPMFRPELSVYARSSDGTVAAYCRGTVDAGNGVCGIDPVCTDPAFQRLGLAKAVVQTCFATQRGLGGTVCYIGSAPEPAPSTRLYRSLGPRRRSTGARWTLPLR